jgi:hypothetical protein
MNAYTYTLENDSGDTIEWEIKYKLTPYSEDDEEPVEIISCMIGDEDVSEHDIDNNYQDICDKILENEAEMRGESEYYED